MNYTREADAASCHISDMPLIFPEWRGTKRLDSESLGGKRNNKSARREPRRSRAFLSHRRAPGAFLRRRQGEMGCEMSAFNIPAVDYTVRLMSRPGSRAATCPTAATSDVGLRSKVSLPVRRTPDTVWCRQVKNLDMNFTYIYLEIIGF